MTGARTDTDPNYSASVRGQLVRIAASPVFVRAGRMYPLLEYLVDAELAGVADRLNQQRIAIDVFGRDEHFDPTVDSIVRVEMGRLRNKLREYYATTGRGDAITLELPKGRYRPTIQVRDGEGAGRPESTPEERDTGTRERRAGHRRMGYRRLGSILLVTTIALVAALLAWRNLAGGRDTVVEAVHVAVTSIEARTSAEPRTSIEARTSAEPRTSTEASASLAVESESDALLDSIAVLPRQDPPPPTASPEAYALYLKTSVVAPEERFALLDRALQIDPNFALAAAMQALFWASFKASPDATTTRPRISWRASIGYSSTTRNSSNARGSPP